jgi:NAD(P)-dependent dehydrogenase (short-subunit alcohol dehydrogenase family)
MPVPQIVRPDLPLAVVVGTGGMGVAVARRLSQRCRVLVADLNLAQAEAAVKDLEREGADASAIACDVTSRPQVQALAAKARALGGFKVLAHVVGLSPAAGDFSLIMRVDLLGAALVAEAFLPLAGVGTSAIFVSSIAGHNLSPPEAVEALLRHPEDPELAEKLLAILARERASPSQAYILSKYALIGFCRRQAKAWGERGARINSISPGLIDTPMGRTSYEVTPEKYKLFERIPLGREGSMLEIADAVDFLASDRAAYITGTDLLVDGGLTAVQAGGEPE